MDLSIIIISYNTKDLLIKCLQSILKANDNLKTQIIVVDNDSTDGSQAFVKQYFSQVHLIENKKNLGFGVANNQAAQVATGEYYLFLNSDTEVVDGAISQLLKLSKQSQAGISTCQLLNPNHTTQTQGGHLPGLCALTNWALMFDDLPIIGKFLKTYQINRPQYFQKNRKLGWIGGTAMLINKDLFKTLEGFDPKIFMYGEDVEICLRAKQKKFKPHYFYQPKIVHHSHGGGTNQKAILGEYQGLKYIYSKHFPGWKTKLLHLLLKTGAFLRMFLFGIITKDAEKKHIYRQAFDLA